MAKKKYTVMGASGQIGRVVTLQLLRHGHKVKALGRNPKKLELLKNLGAEVIILDRFHDREGLVAAFEGADGVFCLTPPGQGEEQFGAYQDKVGESVIKAIQANAIHHVVNLSSVGAHLPEGTGPIKGLYRQEQKLNGLKDLNVIHLRPAFFMENFFSAIPVIHQTGTFKTPLNPELILSVIATPDIGVKAAEFLNKLDFKGQTVFDLEGPRPISITEITKILGSALGKPDLKYAQLSYDELKKGMAAAGMKGEIIDSLIEMYKAFNESKIQPVQKLSAENRGKTTFEQFAKVFAEIYKVQAKQKATIA